MVNFDEIFAGSGIRPSVSVLSASCHAPNANIHFTFKRDLSIIEFEVNELKLIAITGGIATGKSAVSRYLRTLGYPVIDADMIGHEVLELDDVKKSLIQEFGKITDIEGKIDRKQLGKIVFSEPEKLKTLDSITHCRIVEMILNQARELGKMSDEVFIEAAVLFEMGLDKYVDFIIVTDCPDEIRIHRMILRDHLSAEEADKRLKAQLPREEYLKRADFVIETSEELEKTFEKVFEMVKNKPWNSEN